MTSTGGRAVEREPGDLITESSNTRIGVLPHLARGYSAGALMLAWAFVMLGLGAQLDVTMWLLTPLFLIALMVLLVMAGAMPGHRLRMTAAAVAAALLLVVCAVLTFVPASGRFGFLWPAGVVGAVFGLLGAFAGRWAAPRIPAAGRRIQRLAAFTLMIVGLAVGVGQAVVGYQATMRLWEYRNVSVESGPGREAALAPTTYAGGVQWQIPDSFGRGAEFVATPSGLLIIHGRDIELRGDDGERVWRLGHYRGRVDEIHLLGDDRFVVHSNFRPAVHRLSDGVIVDRWSEDLDEYEWASARVLWDADSLLFLDDAGATRAEFDLEAWGGEEVLATADGGAVLHADDGDTQVLVGIDADGEQRWRQDLDTDSSRMVALTDRMVIREDGRDLVGTDVTTGDQVWQTRSQCRSGRSQYVGGWMLIPKDCGAGHDIIDLNTGSTAWTTPGHLDRVTLLPTGELWLDTGDQDNAAAIVGPQGTRGVDGLPEVHGHSRLHDAGDVGVLTSEGHLSPLR